MRKSSSSHTVGANKPRATTTAATNASQEVEEEPTAAATGARSKGSDGGSANSPTVSKNTQPSTPKQPLVNLNLTPYKPVNTSVSLHSYAKGTPPLSTFPFRTFASASLKHVQDERVQARFRRAIKLHKVFSVHPHFPAIKRALLDRGWIEKIRSFNYTVANYEKNPATVGEFMDPGAWRLHVTGLPERVTPEESDASWLSRGLHDFPPDFFWTFIGDRVNWARLNTKQIVNQFPSCVFTTKVGITSCLQNSHWYSEDGVSSTNFPRCYRLFLDEEKSAFINDYRLTACIGLLKWIVGGYEKDGEPGILESVPGLHGSASVVSVEFAIRQVNFYVRVRKHEDVDWLSPPAVTVEHWEVFLNQYYNIVQNKAKLTLGDSEETAQGLFETSKRTLKKLAPYWPQLNSDGTNNIWICKPGDKNRGQGIVLMSQLDRILTSFQPGSHHHDNSWVVQKYIERPLLIYKTKFDIRQWFIVTDWSPLTVWFYKECYLRFCSRPFTIDDFHESIHLTNNAVQYKYQNRFPRDRALPFENMWDNYTFQAYLRTIGKMSLWESVVYPAMKQGVLCVLLASQENVVTRRNSFELYGADFMLSEDFTPWLIEINNYPCMAATTHVTARMCYQCLYDCIKVVIDRRDNEKADTGMFELIYKQTKGHVVQLNGVDTILRGQKVGAAVDTPGISSQHYRPLSKTSLISSTKAAKETPPPAPASTPAIPRMTFTELLQRIKLKDASTKSPITTAHGTSLGTVEPSASNLSASSKHATNLEVIPPFVDKAKLPEEAQKRVSRTSNNNDGGATSATSRKKTGKKSKKTERSSKRSSKAAPGKEGSSILSVKGMTLAVDESRASSVGKSVSPAGSSSPNKGYIPNAATSTTTTTTTENNAKQPLQVPLSSGKKGTEAPAGGAPTNSAIDGASTDTSSVSVAKISNQPSSSARNTRKTSSPSTTPKESKKS